SPAQSTARSQRRVAACSQVAGKLALELDSLLLPSPPQPASAMARVNGNTKRTRAKESGFIGGAPSKARATHSNAAQSARSRLRLAGKASTMIAVSRFASTPDHVRAGSVTSRKEVVMKNCTAVFRLHDAARGALAGPKTGASDGDGVRWTGRRGRARRA